MQIKMDSELHRRAKTRAYERNKTLTELVIELLNRELGNE